MKKFTNPLAGVKVASPCPANWNEMRGDDRRRYCAECKLNVYNLSEMTRREAENFLIDAEGRVCVRFYRRSDGSVLTRDCPVGWQAFKNRVSRTTKAFISLCAGIFGGIFAFNLFLPNPIRQDESFIKVSAIDAHAAPNRIEDFEKKVAPPVAVENANADEEFSDAVLGMVVVPEKTVKKETKAGKARRR